VPGAEVALAARLALADLHVGVAKGHALNIAVIHHIDDRLLLAVAHLPLADAAGLVERYLATLVLGHLSSAFVNFLDLEGRLLACALVRLVAGAGVLHELHAAARLHPVKALGRVY
jgi:hypothetical protein